MIGYDWPHPLFEDGNDAYLSLNGQVTEILRQIDPGLMPELRILGIPCDCDGFNQRGDVAFASDSTPPTLCLQSRFLDAVDDMELVHKSVYFDERLEITLARALKKWSTDSCRRVFAGRFQLHSSSHFASFWLVPMIDVEESALQDHTTLNPANVAIDSGSTASGSLIEAVAKELLGTVGDLLLKVAVNPEIDRPFDEASVLVGAGRRFLSWVEVITTGEVVASPLYAVLNAVSAMPYEGREARGTVMLRKHGPDRTCAGIVLREPVRVAEETSKGVRKLMELARDGSLALHCDFRHFYGAATSDSEVSPPEEQAFSIQIRGGSTWVLRQGANDLMVVTHGTPKPALRQRAIARLKERLRELFPGHVDCNAELLVSLVVAYHEAGVGGLLIISPNSRVEAERLRRQGFAVAPFEAASRMVQSMARVDGAVLLEPNGQCHAFGVVLDGIAQPEHGEAFRGSRYNSAVAYIRSMRVPAVGVVCSVDGDTTIITRDGAPERF
jgi:hypothetical protein